MKKIIALIAFSLLAAGTSFAATTHLDLVADGSNDGHSVYGDTAASGASSTAGVLIGKTSTGVGFGGTTGSGGYAIVTQHKSGSRGVGGAFDSTSLVYKDVTPGVAVTSPSTSTFTTAFTTGWSSM